MKLTLDVYFFSFLSTTQWFVQHDRKVKSTNEIRNLIEKASFYVNFNSVSIVWTFCN